MTSQATQSSMNVCSWTPLLICFLQLAVIAFLHVYFSPGAETLFAYLTFSDNIVMDIN